MTPLSKSSRTLQHLLGSSKGTVLRIKRRIMENVAVKRKRKRERRNTSILLMLNIQSNIENYSHANREFLGKKQLVLWLMVVVIEQVSIRTQMLSSNVIYNYNIPTMVIYSCIAIY